MADKERLLPAQQSYPEVYYASPRSQLFYGAHQPNHYTWAYNPFTHFQPYNPFYPLYPASRSVGEGCNFPAYINNAGEGRQQNGVLQSATAGNGHGKGDIESQGHGIGVPWGDNQTRPQTQSEWQTSESLCKEKRSSEQITKDLEYNLYGDIKPQSSDVQSAKMVNNDEVPSLLEGKQTRGVGSKEDKSSDSDLNNSHVKQPAYSSSYPGCKSRAGLVESSSFYTRANVGAEYWQEVKEPGFSPTADRVSEQLSHMTLPREAVLRRSPSVVYVSSEQMQVFNDELLAARHQLEEYKQKYNSALEEQGQYKKLVSDLSQQITERENENEVLKIQVQILKEDFDLEKEAKESTDSYYRERLKEEKEKRKQLEQMSPHRRNSSFSHLVNNAAVNLTPPVYHQQGSSAGGAYFHDASTGRTCINTPTGNVTVTPSGVTISDCKHCYELGEASDGKHNVNIIINHRGSTSKIDQNRCRSQSETNLQRVSSFEFPSDVVTDGESEE